ncbi:helix-turn-helix domain-containing protein [Stackebrandtia soli]|uniref:helix-turn-helix domain-containing protein n=1 Tax=Stackebrandtia soli TaxID=1892856 RepID=UPI0039E76120
MELGALGISADQERAYRALVTHGPATPAALATALGTTEPTATTALTALHLAGLATAESDHYRAAPPELALRALLVRRRDELGRAEGALAELTELFRTHKAAGSIRDLVEVVVGADGVRQRFTQIQYAATTEVRAFVKPDPIVMTAGENTAEGEALTRGVRYRVILERSILDQPGMMSAIEETVSAGEEVRSTEELALRMIIADNDVALVPLATGGEPGAVVVRPSGLLDALTALFEQTWRRSAEVITNGPATTDPSDLDNRVVSMLLQGFGDKSISKQLNVSPRTVQRRIRYLMDEAGVDTRMQLGYWLGRHSVTPPP